MRTPLFSVLALLAASTVSGKSDLQVTAVRFWTLSDVTRVAIEVNGGFDFKRDRLSNPDRLFFDIMGARPNIGGLRFSTKQVSDRLLKQIRIAETVPGRTRVVLDLAGAADCTVSKLENPDRLMIELHGAPGQKNVDAKPTVISAAPRQMAPAPPTVTPAPAAVATPPAAAPVTPELAKPARLEPVAIATPPAPVGPPAVDESPVAHVPEAPSKPASDASKSLIRALGLKINRVVIDAGHGGHDVGTTGPTGLLEKDLVLDVALRLGKLIEQRLGSDVIYTRHDDTFVPLEERTAIANRSHADLFLSIHANSSPIKAATRVETYYLNFTTSKDDMDLAARENASTQKTISELRDQIQKISLHDKMEESKEFATDIQRTMEALAARNVSTGPDRGIKQAPFVVLIGAQMPSVLSEIGFISNPKEETLMKRSDYRQQLAEALYKGLARYVDSLSHVQVASQATSPVVSKPERGDTPAAGAAK